MRNTDGIYNKQRSIENTMEVNIFYKEHREKTEINVIREQKQNVTLAMLWLACYNSEIYWRTEEIKIRRCLEEYRKQWLPKQKKPR